RWRQCVGSIDGIGETMLCGTSGHRWLLRSFTLQEPASVSAPSEIVSGQKLSEIQFLTIFDRRARAFTAVPPLTPYISPKESRFKALSSFIVRRPLSTSRFIASNA